MLGRAEAPRAGGVNQGELLLILLLLPFVGSVCAAVSPANLRNAEAVLSGAVAVVGVVIVAVLLPAVADGGVVRTRIEWLPSFGLNLTLRMDGFA